MKTFSVAPESKGRDIVAPKNGNCIRHSLAITQEDEVTKKQKRARQLFPKTHSTDPDKKIREWEAQLKRLFGPEASEWYRNNWPEGDPEIETAEGRAEKIIRQSTSTLSPEVENISQAVTSDRAAYYQRFANWGHHKQHADLKTAMARGNTAINRKMMLLRSEGKTFVQIGKAVHRKASSVRRTLANLEKKLALQDALAQEKDAKRRAIQEHREDLIAEKLLEQFNKSKDTHQNSLPKARRA